MAGKTGVFICSGCEIGSATDTEALRQLAEGELRVPVCRTHPFLCSDDGVDFLKGELQREGLDRLVLGACSSRYHGATFDFGRQTLTARAPLREYVAWTQPHGTEDTQMMAADYLRMHVAAIGLQEPPVPLRPPTEKTLLVVGGGVTGMTAALEAARAGYPVHLVEKAPRLGGFALRLHRRTPSAPPYRDLEPAAPDELVRATEERLRSDGLALVTLAVCDEHPGAREFWERMGYETSARVDRGVTLLEADTDGIYLASARWFPEPEKLLALVGRILPAGIELEYDGSYRAMFCYKAKNYALFDGSKVVIRGSAVNTIEIPST